MAQFKSYHARQLFAVCQDQAEWMDYCGKTLTGYVAKYGAKNDPEHSGDGGEAIYAADIAEMEKRMIAFLKAQELI